MNTADILKGQPFGFIQLFQSFYALVPNLRVSSLPVQVRRVYYLRHRDITLAFAQENSEHADMSCDVLFEVTQQQNGIRLHVVDYDDCYLSQASRSSRSKGLFATIRCSVESLIRSREYGPSFEWNFMLPDTLH